VTHSPPDDVPGRVPGADRAIVRGEKIAYLLDERRRVRGDPRARAAYKAGIFSVVLGFTDSGLLRDRLLAHVRGHRPVDVVRDPDHGLTKYVVEGPLRGQNGRSIGMRTIWGVYDADATRTLLSAYPSKSRPV